MNDMTTRQIRTLLVANRGEIAIRIFDTAREMGIECAAVFSDPDRDAKHVRYADIAVHLPGSSSAETYLDMDQVLAAAERVGADAIHPGYGFLSENPEFARRVMAAGLIWIGPPPEAIEAMALKVEAKNTAAAAGVPLVPGAELSGGETDAEIAEKAQNVGYPLMIKASAGGGGKGMRVVESPADLMAAVAGARREAGAAFGNDTVFLERYLPRSRHVEVQVFGDGRGNFVHLFDRECSIQRRHQKIIEEAPSPGATAATRERMYSAAVSLAERIGYVGAGTVEFLVSGDGDAQEFYFLEMNTRLQVEHRVTEQITGTDLVRWQILVAQGQEFNVDQEDLEIDGHAIEVRLYAEDPANGFLPSVGRLDQFVMPGEFTALVDSGYAAGDTVSRFYDPMLAKVITHGDDREEATREMVTALQEVTVGGVATNRDMLLAILASFPFFAADTTTAFLDEHPGVLAPDPGDALPPAPVLVAAAFRHLDGLTPLGDWSVDPFRSAIAGDPVPPRWRNVRGTPGFVGLAWGTDEEAQRGWLRFDGVGTNTWQISVTRGTDPYSRDATDLGAARVTIPNAADPGPDEVFPGDALLVELDGLVHRFEATTDALGRVVVSMPSGQYTFTVVTPGERAGEDTGELGPVAPVPGTVAAVEVVVGDSVAPGQTLVVLEAMKMEHRIVADCDAVVDQVLVQPGQSVDAHQVLVTFAGAGDPSAEADGTSPAVEDSGAEGLGAEDLGAEGLGAEDSGAER